ncbi:MAG: asparagine synthase (glutamine-hydrolyzing) [bacterium]
MCGICGFINYTRDKGPEVLRAMTEIMAHRGPDGCGTELLKSDGVGLGHRRLSIIDLTDNGRQPMTNEDRTIWITYNGEIYNYKDIRKELLQGGHIFRSETDTEIVIHAYEEWGIECLSRFNGMFAFGLWDSREKKLILVRDRLGIKPLYYTEFNGSIAFASEIKPLLIIPEVNRDVSESGLLYYCQFLWAPGSITPFSSIKKLEPGHYLVFNQKKHTIKQYWDVLFEQKISREKDAVEEIEALLFDAVDKRLISDVPLGAFLSGGVDSSAIMALMRKRIQDTIISYTVGFGEKQLQYDICSDDIRYARMMKEHLGGLDYNEIMLDPNVSELWPKIVWHLEEPIGDPAALSTYLICKEAKHKATVMLSGIGGEETFAGYPRHYAMQLSEYYGFVPDIIKKIAVNPVLDMMPASKPGGCMRLIRNAKKFTKSADLPFHERYLGYFSYYSQQELKDLAYEQHANQYSTSQSFFMNKYFNRMRDSKQLNQILYIDQKTFLPDLNLTYTDKASMAASVEVRVPLLDHRLVELSASISPSLKIHAGKQKYILKKTVEKMLPHDVVWRKKAGFGAPVRAWVKDTNIKAMINEYLSPEVIKKRGLFNEKAVTNILQDNYSGKEDNALKIWQLLTVELWFKTFVDSNGMKPL